MVPEPTRADLGSSTPIAIGLGTNVGDRWGNLCQALDRLQTAFGELRLSPVYESAPMYIKDQPSFLNMAVLSSTQQGPLDILHILKSIESDVGRVIRERNGPREIDLDLLVYGSLKLRSEGAGIESLELPHPRMIERRFVLQPLFDLDPNLVIPGLGSIESILQATNVQTQTVVRLDDAALPLHRDDARR